VKREGTELLRLNTDGGFVVRGSATGEIPAQGSGARLMWFPARWALRAGKVDSWGSTYWDPTNVGAGSVAFGYNTRATGTNALAAGEGTTATGGNSVALGNLSTASGDGSFAAVNGTAGGSGAIAMGNGAQATADDALAFGPSSIANGYASVTIGPSIANGSFGVAIGLQNSASGNFSVAIGKNARTANRQGSIVLGDGCAGLSSDSVYPTANNQIVMRGCGRVKIYSNQSLSSGVELAAGGGSWSSVSDVNRKENFAELDGEEVLARLREVPVRTWNYTSQDPSIRHAGPTAQDFHAAFGLGESELLINAVDIDGVNLAAVKALEARSAKQQERIESLEAEVAKLRAELEAQRRLQAEQQAALAALAAQLKEIATREN